MQNLNLFKGRSIYLVILIFFVVIGFTYYYYENKLRVTHSIYGSHAVTLYYGLENNNTDSVKDILFADIIQFIYDFDASVYSKPAVLNAICYLDTESITSNLKTLRFKEYTQSDYYVRVKKNMEKIDKICENSSSDLYY